MFAQLRRTYAAQKEEVKNTKNIQLKQQKMEL